MKNMTFRQQLRAGIVLLLVCFVLATILKKGFLYNIGWILDGLLFVIHPVCPETWKWRYGNDEKRMERDFRIAGCVVIVIGLITRFGV